MQFRKPKTPEPGRRRLSSVEPARSPVAFSYYANRTTDRNAPDVAGARQRSADGGTTERRVPRDLGRLPLWIWLAVIVVCLVKLLVLTTSPKIVVVEPSSSGVTYLQPEETYANAAKDIFGHNLANHFKLTANLHEVSQQMQLRFPELQTVSTAAPLVGNRPIVYVMPAQPSLVLEAAGSEYVVNSGGVALAKLSGGTDLKVVRLFDETGVVPQIGKQALPGSTVRFVEAMQYQLQHAGLSVDHMTLPQGSAYELDIQLAGKPFVVRANLQEDARQQAGGLIATLKKLGATQPGAYLDVRVPGRVYYK